MAKLTEAQKQKARGLKSARITERRLMDGRSKAKVGEDKKVDKKVPAKLESSRPGNIFTKRKAMIERTVNKAVKGK